MYMQIYHAKGYVIMGSVTRAVPAWRDHQLNFLLAVGGRNMTDGQGLAMRCCKLWHSLNGALFYAAFPMGLCSRA